MHRTTLAAIATVFGLAAAPAFACPDYNLAASESYSASGDTLYQAQQFAVTAGGEYDLSRCGNVRPQTDRGRGFVTAPPDFSFELSRMGRYQLVISTVSDCDSVLLINSGSGTWYYDDDDNGNLDARIALTRPANGRIDVWVGTQDGAYCDSYLYLETFDR